MKRIIALGIAIFVAGILQAQSAYVTRLGSASAWECPGNDRSRRRGKISLSRDLRQRSEH